MATYGRRRALGQHFLKDETVAREIAEIIIQEAEKKRCVTLLEIGPGQGAITHPILQILSSNLSRADSTLQRFLLSERDFKLAEYWKNHVKESPISQGKTGSSKLEFQVELGDFLELSENLWLNQDPLAVVSNLPYSAGTAILARLAQYPTKIPVMVLMFQEEVAQRIRAEPSTPHRGSLSLWIQNRWDVKKLLFVPPRSFSPPPQVNSEVIFLSARTEPRIQMSLDSKDEIIWEALLKLSFAHRRKMLRAHFPWQNVLELSGIDGTKRAEALDWNEWNRLFLAAKQLK